MKDNTEKEEAPVWEQTKQNKQVVKELGKCEILSGVWGGWERNTIGQIPNAHYFVAQQPLKHWGRKGVERVGWGKQFF